MNVFDAVLGIQSNKSEEKPVPAELLEGIEANLMKTLNSSSMLITESIKAVLPVAARIKADKDEDERAEADRYNQPRSQAVRNFPKTRKGITLAGGVGCGKTIAMKCLSKIAGCRLLSIPELALIFAEHGVSELMKEVDGSSHSLSNSRVPNHIIIDDLGAEQDMKNFGQNFPIEEIIMKRYNEMHKYGLITHFATNLNYAEMTTRYGERISSRIVEMTKAVAVKDKSLRS